MILPQLYTEHEYALCASVKLLIEGADEKPLHLIRSVSQIRRMPLGKRGKVELGFLFQGKID